MIRTLTSVLVALVVAGAAAYVIGEAVGRVLAELAGAR